jgi:hypothetical protein
MSSAKNLNLTNNFLSFSSCHLTSRIIGLLLDAFLIDDI